VPPPLCVLEASHVLNGATKSQLAGPEELIALRTPLKPIFGKPKMLKQRGHYFTGCNKERCIK